MPNEEQVALLLSDVGKWNQWRVSHPDELIDLTNADLRNAFLPEANLTDALMADAKLRDAYLNNADLSGAIGLEKTQLQKAKRKVHITLPNGEKRDTLDGIKPKHLIPRPRPDKTAEPAAAETTHAAHSHKAVSGNGVKPAALAELRADREKRRRNRHKKHHAPLAPAADNGEGTHTEGPVQLGSVSDDSMAVAEQAPVSATSRNEEQPVDLLAQSVPMATPEIHEPPPRPVTIAKPTPSERKLRYTPSNYVTMVGVNEASTEETPPPIEGIRFVPGSVIGSGTTIVGRSIEKLGEQEKPGSKKR